MRKGGESDPVVALAGGPGQGAVAMARQVAALFSGLNAARDIVLIDQRGTGRSHPLDCEKTGAPVGMLDLFDDSRLEERVKECLAPTAAPPA